MGMRRFSRSVIVGMAIFAIVALVANAALASGTTVAYSFAGDDDGEYPSTDLILDGAGNLYGTTVQGGDLGGGTVFQLSPSGRGGWIHTVLYSFTGGADGGQPYGGVTLGEDGSLYGTAVIGGTGGTCVEDGCGVAFKLTNAGGTWTETVIHDFTGGGDGYGPGSGLTFDQDGNLYGMTPTGGAGGLGTIYQLRPGAADQLRPGAADQLRPGAAAAWTLRVIHSFTGGDDGGAGSAGRLLLDGDGSLLGVATVGGAFGQGTVFELSASPAGRWRLRTLYAFKGQPDAGFPYGGLVRDAAGNLYGTSYYEGAGDLGAVYQLSPKSGGGWKERVLYSFRGGLDGSNSIATLVFGAGGVLYGTTSEGGAPGCSCGTIFAMTPGPGGRWRESVVYRFEGVPDGAFAYNGMVADPAGNLYGTTVHGGADNEGSIYQFTP